MIAEGGSYILRRHHRRGCLSSFSNSLVIHEEKTTEITTVKVVWICDPNYHKIRRTFTLIISKISLRSYIKHSKIVFHQISKHCEVGKKNSAAPGFFNPLLSVWISDETLFLVLNILLITETTVIFKINLHLHFLQLGPTTTVNETKNTRH